MTLLAKQMNSYPQESRDDYRKNHGVPGVVYVLDNPGLRAGIYKIGCSRHSGAVRADALNKDANTGTPGEFRCVFEFRTLDCGRAEESVHEIFHEKRRGKFGKKLGKNERGTWGQEFFEVDLAEAKQKITQVCGSIDNATRKTKSVQIRASVPTTIAAKLSQSAYDAPIVIENLGNPHPVLKRLADRIALVMAAFVVAFVVGGIISVIVGGTVDHSAGENFPPPDTKPAQVTPIPVEISAPLEDAFHVYLDTQPIPSGTDTEGLGDTQNEAEAHRVIEPGSNLASFDCNKAKSSTEMMICSDAELSRLDYELGLVYTQAKITAINQQQFKQQAEAALTWREENCLTKSCLISWYANRKAILQSLYKPPPVTELTEAQFNDQYRCPESYSTETERIKELSDMLDWYVAHNKDVTVKRFTAFRLKVLADRGCHPQHTQR